MVLSDYLSRVLSKICLMPAFIMSDICKLELHLLRVLNVLPFERNQLSVTMYNGDILMNHIFSVQFFAGRHLSPFTVDFLEN